MSELRNPVSLGTLKKTLEAAELFDRGYGLGDVSLGINSTMAETVRLLGSTHRHYGFETAEVQKLQRRNRRERAANRQARDMVPTYQVYDRRHGKTITVTIPED